jgi:hypothetical protein
MATRRVRVLIASALGSPLIDRIRAVDRRLDVVYRADLVGQPRYPCDQTAPVTRPPAQAAEWAALVAEAESCSTSTAQATETWPARRHDSAGASSPSSGVGHVIEQMGPRRQSDRRDQRGGGARHTTRRVCPVRDALLHEAHAARPRRSDASSLGMVRPRHASWQDAPHRGIRPCGPSDRATRSVGGLRIRAVRRTSSALSGSADDDVVYPPAGLRALRHESDYVALIVPLIPETTRLLGRGGRRPRAVLRYAAPRLGSRTP